MVPLNAVPAIGVLLGVMLGIGLWFVLATIPRLGRPRLVERVAPYVADISVEARALLARRSSDPSPVFGALVGPVLAHARRVLSQWLGGNETVAKRLRQAGSSSSVERFRGEQLAWAAAAFTATAALVLLAPTFVAMPGFVRTVAPFVAAAIGAVLRDWQLQRSVRRRLARVSAELATVLEFLTLSLTAGEGMLDATRRVSRTGSGELPTEFAGIVAAVGTGVPLPTALAGVRDGLDHPAFARAIDQVLGALERGAPLASVLRAQAGDARAEAKRTIIELAGRKEIAMLIPLTIA